MPAPKPNDIRQMVSDSQTAVALEALETLVQNKAPDQREHVSLLQSSYSTAEREYDANLITRDEHGTRLQRVHQAILKAVAELEDDPAKQPTLQDYHRFTCDRVEQNDTFNRLFDQAKGRRSQFYYLYGGDLQSHEGMFKRIAYELEGRLYDYLNPELEPACQSLRIEVTFDSSKQLDIYKENIIKSLFASLSIPVNEHEPLLHKNLLYAIQESPRVQELCEKDYVCIFLHISEYDWDAKLTPTAARWLIREFCQPELPAHSPAFLFFFAIEYDEADEQKVGEIHRAVENSEYIQPLPELNMVYRRDVGKWLEKYKKIAPMSRERKRLFKENFPDEEYYMEDVEIALKKIIDDYNGRGE